MKTNEVGDRNQQADHAAGQVDVRQVLDPDVAVEAAKDEGKSRRPDQEGRHDHGRETWLCSFMAAFSVVSPPSSGGG